MAVTTKTKAKKVAGTSSEQDVVPFELQLLALSDLKEAENNAKLHTPAQVEDIIRSIKEFGFRDPIAVDANYEIVEGHGRVKALTKMGVSKVPALVFKDMTADQVRAYRITHNKLTLSTGFDIGLLATELRGIEASGLDLAVTGFSLGDLESFELQLETTGTLADQESTADASAGSDGQDSGTGDATEEESSSDASSEAQVNYQYVMIFDSKEQQQRWTAFLKHLKATAEGETHAERVDTFLKAQGF